MAKNVPAQMKRKKDRRRYRSWWEIGGVIDLGGKRRHGMEAIGRRRWAISEGYIPSESSYSDRELVSHETACILNAGERDAHVAITIFFADREPVGPYSVTVAGGRTLHLRFNDLDDPQPIPRGTDYASVFESTFRSSCNTRGSIPVAPRSPFCRPSLMRKNDSSMANPAFDFSPL